MYNNKFLIDAINAYKMDVNTAHLAIGLSKPVRQYNTEAPSYEDIEKIADYFQIPVDYIFGRCGDNYKNVISKLEYTDEYPYNLIRCITYIPVDWILTKENMSGLEWALSAIPEKQARAIVSYFKDANTYAQIGKEMNISGALVGKLVHEGLRALRHPVKKRAIVNGMHSFAEIERYAKDTEQVLKARKELLDEREKAVYIKEELLDRKIKACTEAYKIHVPDFDKEIDWEYAVVNIPDMTIEELDLSARTYNCLKRAYLNTLKEVVDCLENNPDYFFKIRNLGATASAEIIRKVDKILHICRFEKKFLKTGE